MALSCLLASLMCASQAMPRCWTDMKPFQGAAIAILALSFSVVGSAQESSEPDFLVVAPGASDVARTQEEGRATVTYVVRDPAPARKTLRFLTAGLAAKGWRPLQGTTGADQSLPDHSGQPPGGATHIWAAGFRDDEGNQVYYSLLRRCPLEQHGLHSVYLEVTGAFYRGDVAARLHTDVKSHPQDCTLDGVQLRQLCTNTMDSDNLDQAMAPQLLGRRGWPQPCTTLEAPGEGDVHVQLLLGANGRPERARILRPVEPHDQACLRAVHSAQFRRGMSRGYTNEVELVCRPCSLAEDQAVRR